MLAKLKKKIISRLYDLLEEERRNRSLLEEERRNRSLLKIFEEIQKESARKYHVEKELKERIKQRLEDAEKRKQNCNHLKGTNYSSRPKSIVVDYNISCHTFSDDHKEVKCMTCGKIWTGEQLWSEEVQNMLTRTTNTPSSSEIALPKDKRVECQTFKSSDDTSFNPFRRWDVLFRRMRAKSEQANYLDKLP